MIELALIFFGTFVVLPAGLSFAVDGDGRDRKKKAAPVVEEPVIEEPLPEPEPILVARLKSTKKTVVTVVPECSDEESETRLRAASLDYLEKVTGLPDETVFEVQDCGDEGMVDIQIVETIEKIN
jgi:hypothetical protein|tara:strand:- start:432 stop:806 length:375 start_codon:yes stop_codon:yes gene_type:complete